MVHINFVKVYSSIKDITDADYKKVKRVWKDFDIKVLGEIMHDFYVQSTVLFLADSLKSFRDKWIKNINLS